MATIQVDLTMLPERFDLTYIDEEGKPQRPIAIHRAIYGSLERFIGILVEHFAGAFPLWLAPVQAVVIPIADRHIEAASELAGVLAVARPAGRGRRSVEPDAVQDPDRPGAEGARTWSCSATARSRPRDGRRRGRGPASSSRPRLGRVRRPAGRGVGAPLGLVSPRAATGATMGIVDALRFGRAVPGTADPPASRRGATIAATRRPSRSLIASIDRDLGRAGRRSGDAARASKSALLARCRRSTSIAARDSIDIVDDALRPVARDVVARRWAHGSSRCPGSRDRRSRPARASRRLVVATQSVAPIDWRAHGGIGRRPRGSGRGSGGASPRLAIRRQSGTGGYDGDAGRRRAGVGLHRAAGRPLAGRVSPATTTARPRQRSHGGSGVSRWLMSRTRLAAEDRAARCRSGDAGGRFVANHGDRAATGRPGASSTAGAGDCSGFGPVLSFALDWRPGRCAFACRSRSRNTFVRRGQP